MDEELYFNECNVSVWIDKKNSGDGLVAIVGKTMNVLHVTVHLKMAKVANFMLYVFHHSKKVRFLNI